MSAETVLTYSTGVRTPPVEANRDLRTALSTLPAGPAARQLAFGTLLVMALAFAAALPFAARPLAEYWAFIPVYQSALVVNDLITAVLLYGQFTTTRARGLLILAAGFVFTAGMAVAHALSFPGLFAPHGVIGGGGQTTAWLYFLWHAGFPLVVCAYVALGDTEPASVHERHAAWRAAAPAILAALAAVAGFALLATAGHDLLPVIMSGNADLPAKYAVAWGTCLLCLLAFGALWLRRTHTLLDLWLMVVMGVWVFDVALSAVFNAGRFSLGFYAGRVYGLLAASFVLAVLLLENARLYAGLLAAQRRERRQAQRALARQAERLRILHDIDRAAATDNTAQAIAEAAIRPLRELLGVPRAIVNLFDLEAGEVQWLAAAGRRRVRSGAVLRYSIRLMGDVEALKRGEPQLVDTRALPPGREVDALLASGVAYYMVVPMIAGGELIGALSFGGERPDFPDDQMVIAREAAMQLAVAVSQARLHERVARQAAELEERVRERTAELEAANAELESFSYSVSHDLHSPLRAVGGYALMLEEDYGAGLDAEGLRLIGVIRANAALMAQLIDDLLRLSQFGRKALAPGMLDMRALAGEVVAELAARHPVARVSVGSLPPAWGDRALLRQVWVNLVGNALKYSARRDGARVEISGHDAGAEQHYRVQDNGAGFDMRYADKLFKVFQRLHHADEFEGTGVGLAIVQRVVLRHGGRVWAESQPGQGACFFFSLPSRPAAEP